MSEAESLRLPIVNPNLKQLICFMRDFRIPPRCKIDLRSFGLLESEDWHCATLRCVKSRKSADLIYVNDNSQRPARAAFSFQEFHLEFAANTEVR